MKGAKMLKPRGAFREKRTPEELALIRFMSRINVVSNPIITPDKPKPQAISSSATTTPPDNVSRPVDTTPMSPKPTTPRVIPHGNRGRQSTSTSSEEEAQLLMNLLMSPQTPHSPAPSALMSGGNANPYFLSPDGSRVLSPFSGDDDDEFKFSCPGLSLDMSSQEDDDEEDRGSPSNEQDDDDVNNNDGTDTDMTKGNTPPTNRDSKTPSPTTSPSSSPPNSTSKKHLIQRPSDQQRTTSQKQPSSSPSTPHSVMSRLVKSKLKSELSTAANTLMKNIGSTFNYAIESRIRVWMESLTKVISMREATAAASSRSAARRHNNNTTEPMNEDEGDDSSSSSSSSSNSSSASSHHNNNHQPQYTHDREICVYNALSGVARCISVDVVRTYFRVNPTEIATEPPPKKKSRGAKGDASSPPPLPTSATYRTKQSLLFEARIDVSTRPGGPEMFVTLQTPGMARGTFIKDPLPGVDDDRVRLLGVEIQLDIQSLLFSIQKQSRFVVRKAAEDQIISSMSSNVVPVLQTDSPPAVGRLRLDDEGGSVSGMSADERLHQHQRKDDYRSQASSSPSSSSSSQSHGSAMDHTMPPPPPREPRVPSCGIVSPSPGSPTLLSQQQPQQPSSRGQQPSARRASALVSPTITTRRLAEAGGGETMESTSMTNESSRDDGASSNGGGGGDGHRRENERGQLPHLVEVACASFADEKQSNLLEATTI